jgi:hypothetical protein
MRFANCAVLSRNCASLVQLSDECAQLRKKVSRLKSVSLILYYQNKTLFQYTV